MNFKTVLETYDQKCPMCKSRYEKIKKVTLNKGQPNEKSAELPICSICNHIAHTYIFL